ncbi:EpsG family protein [Algoriphagus sp. AGSA1]|uniref:EpsG family protein n=1 Tax=Algoriphagus sp. AGSA1 TaxID=2907213 RepID=UPI001F48A5A0|nr:EpsG family protein [Algoriphagus sp. AGSA1]MCE7053704.1 EpsG family protein [Algoriphagus sp. AGSA1]
MGIYLFLLFLLLLFYLLKGKSNSLIFLFIVAAILILISALRAESVGIDHIGYKRGFEYDLRFDTFIGHLFKWDVGWLVLNYAMMLLYDSWSGMLLVIAILTVFPMYYVFKNYTPDPLFAMLIYFLLYSYILSFSLIKQSVAIAWIVLALCFFNYGKKNIKALFCGIVACVVHYSTLFLLPIVFIAAKVRISRKFVIPVLASTFLFGLFSSQTSAITNLISLLPFEKYAHYSDYKADVVVNQFNAYLYILPKNIFCILIFYHLKDTIYSLFKNILFFNLVIANLLYTSIPLISRFVLYGFQLEILLLVYYVYQFNGKRRILVRFSVFVYASFYFAYNLMTNRGGINPYEFDLNVF